MQCTVPTSPPATPAPPRPAASPASLLAAFAAVPDPRRRAGRRFPLAAIRALAVTAILANHLAVLAIAQWGADQEAGQLAALGFPDGVAPHQSTLHRLFRRLESGALATALSRYFAPVAPDASAPPGAQGVAIDGKAQRGRLAFAGGGGGTVHALTAFCHAQGVALAQEEIRSTAAKTEAELTVAPALIARLDWRGRVFTGDALFCQRAVCRQLLAAGGDYLLLVKENQPTLCHDIALLFDPPTGAAPLPLLDRREATTLEKGHGRTHDRRHLVASTDLTGHSDGPGLAQVFRLERTWRAGGRRHRQLHYGLTSLRPPDADAARLLALKRGHWRIENGLHYVKDCTLGEDRSQLRLGAGPAVMALLRDTAISLLRRADWDTIAERPRHFSRHPDEAVRFLCGPPPENA